MPSQPETAVTRLRRTPAVKKTAPPKKAAPAKKAVATTSTPAKRAPVKKAAPTVKKAAPAVKKAAPAVKKAAPAVKKAAPAVQKSVAKKATATTTKAPASVTAKKVTAPARKSAATAARKTVAKNAAGKKAAAKKTAAPVKPIPAKKAAAPARKAAVVKATPAKKAVATKAAPAQKPTPRKVTPRKTAVGKAATPTVTVQNIAASVANADESGGRWRSRPVAAATIRVIATAVPLVASVVSGVVLSRVIHRPSGIGAAIGWWLGIMASSTIVLVLVDRVARRVLPLATLLRLSMAFPDQAPSRFSVAARAGTTRSLQDALRRAQEEGVNDKPAQAAQRILTLVGALGAHDRRTRGHSERVRAFNDLIAEELRMPQPDRDRLRWAALLHDIGKLHVSARILNKPHKPTEKEWAILKSHPERGARIAAPLTEWLGEWAPTIMQHHERWDGRGYPTGLSGADICVGARIVAVADAYEVMTAPRPYSRPVSAAAAREELARCAGEQFDPEVVRAFLNISIGRLRKVIGPISWLAQLPLISATPRLEAAVGIAGRQVVSAAATATGTGVLAAAMLPHAAVAHHHHHHHPAPVRFTATAQAGTFSAPASTPAAAAHPDSHTHASVVTSPGRQKHGKPAPQHDMHANGGNASNTPAVDAHSGASGNSGSTVHDPGAAPAQPGHVGTQQQPASSAPAPSNDPPSSQPAQQSQDNSNQPAPQQSSAAAGHSDPPSQDPAPAPSSSPSASGSGSGGSSTSGGSGSSSSGSGSGSDPQPGHGSDDGHGHH